MKAAGGHVRWVPYLFLAPFLAVFLVFTAYPLVQSLLLAMQQTYGPRTSHYVFVDNFVDLAGDPLFRTAAFNTLVYTAGSLVLQIPLALALALLLNRPRLPGRVFFRLVFFAPSMVGVAFVAVLFGPIFEKNTGLINVWLHARLGTDLELIDWMGQHVMTALIVVSVWMYVGLNMVYFLAALQNVDRGCIKAAMLDGAGPWQRFRHVTLPAIGPVASFVVFLSLIGCLQLFELPFVMLNFTGGPDNRGLAIVMYLYQTGFEMGDLGYASAIGWCRATLLLAMAIAQRKIPRYGGGS